MVRVGSAWWAGQEQARLGAAGLCRGCRVFGRWRRKDQTPIAAPAWNEPPPPVAGCPTATANLWDVTDKDIDRLTKQLLEGWLVGGADGDDAGAGGDDAGDGTPPATAPPTRHRLPRLSDIGDAVVQARAACRLRYLNAAAAVTYGLPTAALVAGDA